MIKIDKETYNKFHTMKELLRQADIMIPKPHEGGCDWDCRIECRDRKEWRDRVMEVLGENDSFSQGLRIVINARTEKELDEQVAKLGKMKGIDITLHGSKLRNNERY